MSVPSKVLALTLCLVACLGRAQLSAEDQLEFKSEIGLGVENLLGGIRALGIPLVWDPKSRAIQGKEVAGPIEFRGTREEILAALRSLLTFYDLVMVPAGEGDAAMLLVLDARQAAAIVRLKPLFIELDESSAEAYAGKDGLFVSALIRFTNPRSMLDVRSAFARIVTGQNIGSVTEISNDSLVVTDFAPNVVQIWRLARYMDRIPESTAEREPIFRAVRLKAAVAGEVAELVASQLGPEGRSKPGPQGTAPGRAQPPQPPQPRGEPSLRVDADARTNQVLLTGPASLVEEAQRLIATLDIELAQPDAAIQVVRLAHVTAAGAAQALTSLIARATGAFGGGPRPVVEPHHETNALLVYASPQALAALRRVIAEMDVPRAESGK
jgi:hypothetical protein